VDDHRAEALRILDFAHAASSVRETRAGRARGGTSLTRVLATLFISPNYLIQLCSLPLYFVWMKKDMVLFVKPQLVVFGNRADHRADHA
jgi:hypothetical protein